MKILGEKITNWDSVHFLSPSKGLKFLNKALPHLYRTLCLISGLYEPHTIFIHTENPDYLDFFQIQVIQESSCASALRVPTVECRMVMLLLQCWSVGEPIVQDQCRKCNAKFFLIFTLLHYPNQHRDFINMNTKCHPILKHE